jgi:magnesium chelatase family protein
MNPCPCGFHGDPQRECRCSSVQIERYRNRISGPLLDRIDIHVEAPAVAFKELSGGGSAEPSADILNRVLQARGVQKNRFTGERKTASNARMSHSQIKKFCPLDDTSLEMLRHAMEDLHLSARAYDRILKVARTIADLAASGRIESPHLLEAIQHRSLDRAVFY